MPMFARASSTRLQQCAGHSYSVAPRGEFLQYWISETSHQEVGDDSAVAGGTRNGSC